MATTFIKSPHRKGRGGDIVNQPRKRNLVPVLYRMRWPIILFDA